MNTGTLDMARIASILSARWKLVAAVTMAVMTIALAYTQTATKVFQATAQVGYQAPGRDVDSFGLPNSGDRLSDINTLAAQAGSTDVLASAATELELPGPIQLSGAAKVAPHSDANILDFSAKAATAERAAEIANVYAESFAKGLRGSALKRIDTQIKSITGQLVPYAHLGPNDAAGAATKASLLNKKSDLDLQRQSLEQMLPVSKATLPTGPVWPKTSLTLFAALLVGFGLACGLALIRASLDRKLRDDLIEELPAPVLVSVPEASQAPKSVPLGPALAEPIIADAFAALGSRVLLDRRGDGAHVVLVSSARSGEGKSSVASNLAAALAQGGRRVVLVDADMRRPTQDIIFPSLQGRAGLSQVLAGTVDVEQALTLIAPNLAAIGSGPKQQNASVMLASVAFRSLIDRLSMISEVVVIDAPPVLPVTDSLSIAPAAHQVLLCARVGASNLGEIEAAFAKLAAASTTPQSIVVLGTARPVGYGYEQESMRPASASYGLERVGMAQTVPPPTSPISVEHPSPPAPQGPNDGSGQAVA